MATTLAGAKLTDLHKILQIRLSSQSMAATKVLWSTLDPSKGKAAMDAWLKQQVALSGVFDKKSSALAADYVKKFRAAEGFPGGPIAVEDFDPTWAEQSMSYNGSNKVQALMDSGITAKQAMSQVASSAMSAAQRLTLGGGRSVIDKSALANPASKAWRRVSDGSPCTFCAMLVSRGDAYHSESSAGAGRHWHKKCGCTVEEVFGDWAPTKQEQAYVDAYDDAAAHLDSLGKPHTQTQILEHMRSNGKFNDSPVPKILDPNPSVVAGLKADLKSGKTTLAALEDSYKDQIFVSKKVDIRAAIDQHKADLKPKPYPQLGDNFRIDHTGQIWKGYKYKIKDKSGTSWKKVDDKGVRIHKDPPTKKQLAEIAATKAAEAAEAAAKAAKAAHDAADAAVKASLGQSFRLGPDGQIWKGYKYKVQGKEGVSWKKVDESGKRINPDPPTKKKVATAEDKKTVAAEAKKTSETTKAKVSEPDVVLKNDYQKYTAESYGWGQPELKAWVKSGLPMSQYKASLSAVPKKVLKTTPIKVGSVDEPKFTHPQLSDNPTYKVDADGQLYKKSTKIWEPISDPPPGGASYSALQNKWYGPGGKPLEGGELGSGSAATVGYGATPKISAAPGQGGMSWAENHWPSASKYTPAERRGFESYTGSGYRDTNSALRRSQGKVGRDTSLDAAFRRPTSVVPNDTVAYRGVHSAKALGLNTDSGDLSKLLGSEYVEHGYMSTAVEGSGFGGNISMAVKIPKGHRAVFVAHQRDSLSTFGSSEKELLLDRGTRFRVTEVEKVGSNWSVVVEVIPPPVHA